MGVDITGEINFFSHTIDGSFPVLNVTPNLGSATTNFARTPARVTIHDLRGKENIVDLDNNGFEILKYDGHIHDVFDDNSEMQRRYYEDITTVLKKRLNASRVIAINHAFRFRGPPRPADQCDTTHKNPNFYPHVDFDPHAARNLVEETFGEEEAKKVMQNRFQLINVWRPLGPNPIMNVLLAVCDYRSLDSDNDIHVSKLLGTKVAGTIYLISRNSQDAQKWYYLSQMQSDEMFVFKNYDSNPDVAQFGPHTAFNNDNVTSNDVEQISIELRCLVLFDQ
jgi:hypothetical protein